MVRRCADVAAANILLDGPFGPGMIVELCDMASMVQLPCHTTAPQALERIKQTPMTGEGARGGAS